MNSLSKEKTFFNDIAPKVRELVLQFNGKASVSVQKRLGDYATEVDLAVEELVVKEINDRFPNDLILAEEGHSDTEIPDGRIWIIDPICGTTNVGRGVKNFCTNIALADKGVLIASCVVDHSQNDYFWSVGQGAVYVNDVQLQPVERNADFGVVIDVDMGSIENVGDETKQKYIRALDTLLRRSGCMPASLNTSLGFAYTAIGKFDGFINVYNHPWDICASSFLLQQAGGIITQLDGTPWTITSTGAIGARNNDIHQMVLSAYNNNTVA